MKRAEDVSGAVDENQLLAICGHQSKLSDTVLKAKAVAEANRKFMRDLEIIVLTVSRGVFN